MSFWLTPNNYFNWLTPLDNCFTQFSNVGGLLINGSILHWEKSYYPQSFNRMQCKAAFQDQLPFFLTSKDALYDITIAVGSFLFISK